MEEDTVNMGTGPTAETRQTAIEITSPPLREPHGGYEGSRFNAVRHGVLSRHTVLPWENKEEYATLLGALAEEYAPRGPTEDHLVEEIAGVIWRKRRLRLAEAASYRRGIEKATERYSKTLDTALIQVERTLPVGPIMDAVTATPSATAKDLVEWKRREASARSALEILSAGKPGAYEAALGELDERTRTSWQEEFFPELEDPDEDKNADEDEDPNDECAPILKADATGLAEYLEGSVLPDCAMQLGYVENRSVIRAQVLGEALDLGRLAPLGRYEIQLDRKLERMLAMLLRLHSLRRSNESS